MRAKRVAAGGGGGGGGGCPTPETVLPGACQTQPLTHSTSRPLQPPLTASVHAA